VPADLIIQTYLFFARRPNKKFDNPLWNPALLNRFIGLIIKANEIAF
jgi:hypothetical protein